MLFGISIISELKKKYRTRILNNLYQLLYIGLLIVSI